MSGLSSDIFEKEEVKAMIATLFANRIILGKNTFKDVPQKLKQQVADILINECGLPDLVPESYGGYAPND